MPVPQEDTTQLKLEMLVPLEDTTQLKLEDVKEIVADSGAREVPEDLRVGLVCSMSITIRIRSHSEPFLCRTSPFPLNSINTPKICFLKCARDSKTKLTRGLKSRQSEHIRFSLSGFETDIPFLFKRIIESFSRKS